MKKLLLTGIAIAGLVRRRQRRFGCRFAGAPGSLAGPDHRRGSDLHLDRLLRRC